MPATRSRFRMSTVGIAILTLLTPWIIGQGCTSGTPVPIPEDPAGRIDTGNQPPLFVFTSPGVDIIATVGEVVRISWVDEDPDSTAVITLLLDPDDTLNNGNEILAAPILLEDPDTDPVTGQDYVDVDTGELGLVETDYRVIARVNDGVNPELIVIAPGRLDMRARFLPPNTAPHLVLTSPEQDLGFGQGEIVDIAWCARDPDDDAVDPANRTYTPDVIILLDLDDNPNNDIDLTGPDAEETVIDLCLSGQTFPLEIPGAIVLGCFKDDDCANDNLPTGALNVIIDIDEIPPRPAGQAYWIRGTMWDHLNRPVHSYARGAIRVTGFGTGVIDLAEVGKTLKGSVFVGHDATGLTGFNGIGVGDISGDGVDDLAIVSRYGRPFGQTNNVGTVHVVEGLAGGQQFAGEIPLNSLINVYPGKLFTMPPVDDGIFGTSGITEGIVTITKVGDVNRDGANEFMVGMPFIETFFDWLDDDPWDPSTPGCYSDGLPNPRADGGNCDTLGAYDWREGYLVDELPTDPVELANLPICSNDNDLFFETPISGGYTVLVTSENWTTTEWIVSDIISLGDIGQFSLNDGTPAPPFGARFRGAWYPFLTRFDATYQEYPYSIDPENRFGETISSMPDLDDIRYGTPDDFGPGLILSAPYSNKGLGSVTLHFGQDFSRLGVIDPPGCTVRSFPWYAGARFLVYPGLETIDGEEEGDHLGYGHPAGDYNRDGWRDIAAGSPDADRDGLVDNGIVYIIYGRPDLGRVQIDDITPPRIEIHGTSSRDHFGLNQEVIGDINQDGLPDIAFSTPYYDGPGGIDSGFIGILFGGRALGVGTEFYTVDEVGGPSLPGVHIYGSVAGGHAGVKIANAGDFNADGNVDLLVLAPNETRFVNGQTRLGVVYLLFGGPHLNNGPFQLSQIGSDALPGVVFVSPFEKGSADEATIDFANPAGDVNGDGFADILLGTSEADWVNPLDPTKRRLNAGRAYLFYGSNVGSNGIR